LHYIWKWVRVRAWFFVIYCIFSTTPYIESRTRNFQEIIEFWKRNFKEVLDFWKRNFKEVLFTISKVILYDWILRRYRKWIWLKKSKSGVKKFPDRQVKEASAEVSSLNWPRPKETSKEAFSLRPGQINRQKDQVQRRPPKRLSPLDPAKWTGKRTKAKGDLRRGFLP
jgi:hypothetical protein